MEADEITVNGIEYVKKQSVEIDKDYVIVRARSAGVFAGDLVSVDGDVVKLANARRLWYWDGAASVSQIAIDGVSKPETCKFPAPVAEQLIREWIEIIPATMKAKESIMFVPVWSE